MILFKKILFLLIALLFLALVGAFLLPGSAQVERTVNVAAPTCTVQAQVESYRRFNEWSPWAKLDPDTQYTFEGPARGVGSKMTWVSENKNVGSGSQEIVSVEPGLVKSVLDFGPQGQADAFFRMQESGEGTDVTWGFETEFGLNPIARYFGLLIDRMVGKDFEAGLVDLKAMVETLPNTNWCDLEVEVVDVEPMSYAYATGSSGADPVSVGAALGEAYGEVMAFLGQRRLSQVGPPLAVTNHWDASGYGFDAGIPVSAPTEMQIPEDSVVKIGKIEPGLAVRAIHRGPYDGIAATGEKLEAYLAVQGFEAAGRSWDVFVNDPGSTPPESLETHLYIPLGEG